MQFFTLLFIVQEVNPTAHNDMKKLRGSRVNPSRKHRVPEPSADDWHFRNQGYEENEIPTDGYQTGLFTQ